MTMSYNRDGGEWGTDQNASSHVLLCMAEMVEAK